MKTDNHLLKIKLNTSQPAATLLLALFMGPVLILQAQQVANLPGHEASYFIDLNVDAPFVHELPGNICSIKYFDAIDQNDVLPVTIYDWKRQPVANYRLSKSYGLNYYNIPMDFLQPGQAYLAQAVNEAGMKYSVSFKVSDGSTLDRPYAEIKAVPVTLDCESAGDNLMEFQLLLAGGRAPYQVRWFILDEQMNDLLYLPRSEEITSPGKGMTISVDADPAYHVMAQVEDACGNKLNKVVSVDCQQEEKVYHSIFVEPLSRIKSAAGTQ